MQNRYIGGALMEGIALSYEEERVLAERLYKRNLVERFVEDVVGMWLHPKQLISVTNGVDGVMHASALGIRAIGRGLAAANSLTPRHAIKQVDRLLSNGALDLEKIQRDWVRYVLCGRSEVFVNFDWTEFDDSDQSILVLGTQTGHGRSTPLLWATVRKSETKDRKTTLEREMLERFAEIIPPELKVTLVADRGFGSVPMYSVLDTYNIDYVIRFRGNINVTNEHDETRLARDWLSPTGRARRLRNVKVTCKKYRINSFVCVRQKGMKDAWFLATSRSDLSTKTLLKIYNKRFSIEETFRDLKDHRFGLGMGDVKMERLDRRDRLFLLATLAHTFLTLLGQAGRAAGLERFLGATREGTMALFTMGRHLFQLMPSMKKHHLKPLLEHFGQILLEHPFASKVFAVL